MSSPTNGTSGSSDPNHSAEDAPYYTGSSMRNNRPTSAPNSMSNAEIEDMKNDAITDMTSATSDDKMFTIDGYNPFIYTDPVKQDNIIRDVHSFNELYRCLKTQYWGPRSHTSVTIDMIALFLKGQKYLYIESSSYCRRKLNVLMVPAIFISALCSVLSVAMEGIEYGTLMVAGLTAFNSLLLAMITYLKLDAMSESHRISAYKFEKLQTKCEFQSGKTLYSSFNGLNKLFEDVEKNIQEIKEVNQFVIPEMIRYRFPNLYNINIFTEIKKLSNEERQIVYELNNVYNKISDISYKDPSSNVLYVYDMELYYEYMDHKDDLIHDYITQRDKFLSIDTVLTHEIKDYIESVTKPYWLYLVCCFHYSFTSKKNVDNLLPKSSTPRKRKYARRPFQSDTATTETPIAVSICPIQSPVLQQKKPVQITRTSTYTSLGESYDTASEKTDEKTADKSSENRIQLQYKKMTDVVEDEDDAYLNVYGI